ncbi:hypothetical protein J6590_049284 [Homalodisca vitripennis]|nr:hypothetical protein J6590_049284 [Homalodisca vitripennis]
MGASCDKSGPEKSGTGVTSRTEPLPQFPGARPPYSQHRKPDGPKGLAPGVIPEKTPSAVQSTHQSLRQFRDTPRVLRYAPVEKKEEVTPTWGRRKEEVGEICPEKIKDVELRSERENKDLSSRRTVRRVSQLGSGNPGVASLPEERGGLPCSRKPTTPEDISSILQITNSKILYNLLS